MLTEAQCDALCEELGQITERDHPRFAFWYQDELEAGANTVDPSKKLTHALGARPDEGAELIFTPTRQSRAPAVFFMGDHHGNTQGGP